MSKIGIISAIEAELKPYLNKMTDVTISTSAKLKFHQGKLAGRETVAVSCGMCKTNAAIATCSLIDKYGVDSIIVSGVVGGIDTSLGIGDTVISTQVAHHDVNDEFLRAYPPFLKDGYFYANEKLVNLFRDSVNNKTHKQKIMFGTMVTGEAFIEDDGRNEIIEKFNPLCVDMETASVAHVCYVHDVPFIAVRSMSDTAEHSGFGTFEQNCAIAAQNSFEAVYGAICML